MPPAVRHLALGMLALAYGTPASAQEPPRIEVRVRQIAGSTIYLDAGHLHGLETGDTVRVARDSLGATVGSLVVTASTDTRSVLAFAGPAFAVTRGARLILLLLREPSEQPASALTPTVRPRPPPRYRLPRSTRTPPPTRTPAYGRFSMGLSTLRASTRFGGADAVTVDRTFATPSMRLDMTAPGAVEGFTFRLSTRVAYRYSSSSSLQPATATRVYAASLERQFVSFPARLILGRFHSPVESYSGFWDGAFVRVGGRGLGVAALVGFEPDRWNERPSSELPKATLVIDAIARGKGWRWSGDLSAHTVRPADTLSTRTYFGMTQRLSAGGVFLSHDLQIDRDPAGGGVRISRLRLRGSLDVGSGVQIRVGAFRRESFLISRLDDPFGPRSDRLTAGAMVRTSTGFLAVDGAVMRDADGRTSYGTTGSFSLDRVRWINGGVGASVSRWSGRSGTTFTAAPAVHFALAMGRVRVGYRFFRSDYLSRITTTHGAEASLDAPIGSGLRISARGRLQWGSTLRNQGLDLTLSRIF
jgi:hypothetical protein